MLTSGSFSYRPLINRGLILVVVDLAFLCPAALGVSVADWLFRIGFLLLLRKLGLLLLPLLFRLLLLGFLLLLGKLGFLLLPLLFL